MKRSINAALLSAFVCPGTGHLYIGKKAIGWGIIVACFISLCAIMTVLMQRAQAVADDIVAGNIALDFNSLYGAVHDSVSLDLPPSVSIATWLLFICWIGSTVSAYWMAEQLDKPSKDSTLAP
ncbi:hypothetical protein [Shewanella sp. UCD-KL21]|uniref:hypothetical protein n=1 Tax=Shewanella sp. UCD-KL21 TaxID=1917164 RepID=UPI000970EB85|nr:hypothetical protein [Shewanella sp. UCD-KL21]